MVLVVPVAWARAWQTQMVSQSALSSVSALARAMAAAVDRVAKVAQAV